MTTGTEKVTLWLTPATTEALQAEAQHRGMKYSTLAEELIDRGLAEDMAGRVEERVLPAFTTAMQGVMAEHLRRFERRLTRRLAGIERNAGMASRIGYVHLYRSYPDEAEADWQEATEQIEMERHESNPLASLASVDDAARSVER